MFDVRRAGTTFGWMVLSILLCRPGAAQETRHPIEGTRLRVTVWNTPIPSLAMGTLRAVAGDTLVLTPPEGSDIRVPTNRILLVERSIRPQRPNGGRFGFLIGAGVATLVLKMAFDEIYQNPEYNLAGAVLLGVPLGGLIGAVAGSARAQEKWAPVQLAPATAGPAGRP